MPIGTVFNHRDGLLMVKLSRTLQCRVTIQGLSSFGTAEKSRNPVSIRPRDTGVVIGHIEKHKQIAAE